MSQRPYYYPNRILEIARRAETLVFLYEQEMEKITKALREMRDYPNAVGITHSADMLEDACGGLHQQAYWIHDLIEALQDDVAGNVTYYPPPPPKQEGGVESTVPDYDDIPF